MKRFIISLILATISLSPLALVTSATAATQPFDEACSRLSPAEQAESSVCSNKNNTDDPITGTDQEGLILRAANILARIAGLAAVIILIYGSIKYVTSGGDKTKVTAARETIQYAFIGLVIIALAEAIILFLISRTS